MAYSDAPMTAPCEGLTKDASCDDLYKAGIAYATGSGIEADLVAAHKWFNLAALKGSGEAKIQRKEMAELMTAAEIRQALSAAREWLNLVN
ncbi:MAG: hypothetical protein AAFQ21_09220 [Pseudomonadota bacterium]